MLLPHPNKNDKSCDICIIVIKGFSVKYENMWLSLPLTMTSTSMRMRAIAKMLNVICKNQKDLFSILSNLALILSLQQNSFMFQLFHTFGDQGCTVFQPANRCFTCHLLVKIIFLGALLPFSGRMLKAHPLNSSGLIYSFIHSLYIQ